MHTPTLTSQRTKYWHCWNTVAYYYCPTLAVEIMGGVVLGWGGTGVRTLAATGSAPYVSA